MAKHAIQISKWKHMTEAEALDDDWDMIPTLTSYQKTLDFCRDLERRRPQIEELIARHLGVSLSDFVLLQQSYWIWGSFNMCLPIDIECADVRNRKLPTQAMIRFPLPFRAAEDYNPGNVDEKLRCEAATYIWLRERCPSIPIPRLLGIGLPGTLSLIAIENEMWMNRVVWRIRKGWAWLHGATISPFVILHRAAALSDLGYLLLEYVVQGKPLSSSWQHHRHDETRRMTLYRDLSNILIDPASVPLPCAGSWTMDDCGTILLANRPLLDLTMLWNRHGIPTNIPKDRTYTSAQSFIQDMLLYHDDRMRYQLNSILDRQDGIYQLSALTALRALLPMFWPNSSQGNLFVLSPPDLHRSNIFVDDDWNVVGLIDFEFAPVQPAQMAGVPLWLNDSSVDELHGSELVEYRALHDQFVAILEQEEANRRLGNALSSQIRENG